MFLSRWLKHRTNHRAIARPRFRPGVEGLEAREVPATLAVWRAEDNGALNGTLRHAVLAAHDGDTIAIAANLQNATITLTEGELVLDHDVVVRGLGRHRVTISGGDVSRVFAIHEGTDVTLSHLRIADGYVQEATDFNPYSGAGVANAGDLVVTDCNFSGNAASWGGGLYNAGTLSVTDTTFTGNSAFESGGGIYNEFASEFMVPTMTIDGCAFTGNATLSYGGGFDNNGLAWVSNTLVDGNYSAGSSAGIDNDGPITLTDCVITNNRSETGYGGGFWTYADSTLTRCTIAGNSANYGGGIATGSWANVTITDCTISNNVATYYGGGIYNSDLVTLTITSSVLSGNSADVGGGIANFSFVYEGFGGVTIDSSTLTGNTANLGGGIYNLDWGGGQPSGQHGRR